MLIALSNGGHALIDDDLYEAKLTTEVWDGEFLTLRICDYTWRHKDKARVPYIQAVICRRSRQACIRLHRLVMEAKKGQIVDHVNRDVSDNRRVNLRICTHSENNLNRSKQVRRGGIYTNPITGEQLIRSFESGREVLRVLEKAVTQTAS